MLHTLFFDITLICVVSEGTEPAYLLVPNNMFSYNFPKRTTFFHPPTGTQYHRVLYRYTGTSFYWGEGHTNQLLYRRGRQMTTVQEMNANWASGRLDRITAQKNWDYWQMRQQIGLHITDNQYRLHMNYPRFTRPYYLKRDEQAAHMGENMTNLKAAIFFDKCIMSDISFRWPSKSWSQRDLIF